jgi:hypothetical protein
MVITGLSHITAVRPYMPAQSPNRAVHFRDHKGLLEPTGLQKSRPEITTCHLNAKFTVTDLVSQSSTAVGKLEAWPPIADPLSVESEDGDQL